MKPYQVLSFIAITMAVLGALYWAFPEGKVWHNESAEYTDYTENTDTIAEFPVFAEAEAEVEVL